jgi:hypothetical protein
MCYSQLNKENLGNHRTIECNRSKRLLAKLSAIGSLFCFCYWSVSYVHYREPYFFQSPPLNGYSSVATLGCQQEREPTGQEPTKERYDTIKAPAKRIQYGLPSQRTAQLSNSKLRANTGWLYGNPRRHKLSIAVYVY